MATKVSFFCSLINTLRYAKEPVTILSGTYTAMQNDHSSDLIFQWETNGGNIEYFRITQHEIMRMIEKQEDYNDTVECTLVFPVYHVTYTDERP